MITKRCGRGRPLVRQGALGQWLQANGINRTEAARELGICRRYLDHLARDDRRPSLKLAIKLQRMTRGQISIRYFVSLPEHTRR